MQPFEILYEDNHLLIVNKPAGLATMGVAKDKPSVLTRAKEYIAEKYNKPGNVYLGIVSRLDAPVTGVLTIARTSKAAKRLTEAFRNRDVEKIYWAVIPGRLDPPAGQLEDFVRKHERHRKVLVVPAAAKGAQLARLSYQTLQTKNGKSLVKVKLETGRKHQIRVQLAERSHSIIGDRKYDSDVSFEAGIALHSRRIEFEHPVRKTPIIVQVDPPKSWRRFPFDYSNVGGG